MTVLGQTGAEAGTPVITATGARLDNACLFVAGNPVPPGCGGTALGLEAPGALGDLPHTHSGSRCILDLPIGGPCEVSSQKLHTGESGSPTLVVTVLDIGFRIDVPFTCTGVGQSCSE